MAVGFSIKTIALGTAMTLGCAGLAFAQSAQPTDDAEAGQADGPIIVEGYTEQDIRQFLWRSFVETNGKLARRQGPVCIGIDNLDPQFARPIQARIEANLRDLGQPVAEPGCSPNALIAFTNNAPGFVRYLDETEPRIFQALYKPEKRRLIREDRDYYSWGFIGSEASETELVDFLNRNTGTAFFATPEQNSAASRIQGDPPATISHTFTVVDKRRINRMTDFQLGDFLTMQILLEFQPQGALQLPPDSILTLFDGDDPDSAPQELSRLDRAILQQVYDAQRMRSTSGVDRSRIASATLNQIEDEGILLDE